MSYDDKISISSGATVIIVNVVGDTNDPNLIDKIKAAVKAAFDGLTKRDAVAAIIEENKELRWRERR